MIRKKSPKDESLFNAAALNVNKIAPKAPSRIPHIRVIVMCSFKTKRDKTTTIMGFNAIIIPEFIAEDKFKP